MKVGLTSLSGWLLGLLPLLAQSDSASLDYIWLQKYRPGDTLAVQPWEGDFMRRRQLLRLRLDHPAHAALQSLAVPGPFDELCPGLPGLLLAAWQQGQVTGLQPADPHQSLSYQQLLMQLIDWQELNPEQGQISGSALGLEWLGPQLDLIVDIGVSRQDSRAFRRIRFVRLIWHHPQLAQGPRYYFPTTSSGPISKRPRCKLIAGPGCP